MCFSILLQCIPYNSYPSYSVDYFTDVYPSRLTPFAAIPCPSLEPRSLAIPLQHRLRVAPEQLSSLTVSNTQMNSTVQLMKLWKDTTMNRNHTSVRER